MLEAKQFRRGVGGGVGWKHVRVLIVVILLIERVLGERVTWKALW